MDNNSKTVLYVEDEESDRFFMEAAFRKEGLRNVLQAVADGQAAIDYLSGIGGYSDRGQHPFPSLVLLDLNLPEVSGLEVLKWIREHPEHRALLVVVFTSSSRDEDRRKALELGVNDFWQKPASGLLFRSVVNLLKAKWL